MNANGHHRQTNLPPATAFDEAHAMEKRFAPPPAQPLVRVEQTVSQLQSAIALRQQTQQLQIERLASAVAIANSALPIIKQVVGTGTENLTLLAQVVLGRNVDIAEDVVEIEISDQG